MTAESVVYSNVLKNLDGLSKVLHTLLDIGGRCGCSELMYSFICPVTSHSMLFIQKKNNNKNSISMMVKKVLFNNFESMLLQNLYYSTCQSLLLLCLSWLRVEFRTHKSLP